MESKNDTGMEDLVLHPFISSHGHWKHNSQYISNTTEKYQGDQYIYKPKIKMKKCGQLNKSMHSLWNPWNFIQLRFCSWGNQGANAPPSHKMNSRCFQSKLLLKTKMEASCVTLNFTYKPRSNTLESISTFQHHCYSVFVFIKAYCFIKAYFALSNMVEIRPKVKWQAPSDYFIDKISDFFCSHLYLRVTYKKHCSTI